MNRKVSPVGGGEMAARIRLVIKTCLLAAFAVVTAAQTVEASSIALKISDGTTTITVLDNQVGDRDATLGVIDFSGLVGAWNVNKIAGLGEPIMGAGSMHLNSLNVASTGTTSTLQIWFTMYDIDTVYPGFNNLFGGTATNANASFSALVSDPNLLYQGTTYASLGPFTGAFAGTTAGAVSVGVPYSLTQLLTITGLTAGTRVSFSADVETNAVPEPGSMLLLGTGLFAIGGLARRRFQARRSVK